MKVLAQGTGQALDTARRGDADVVLVHAKSAEEKFLAEGEGVKRFPVMYNDFVLIGPKGDPAGIKGMKDVAKAFQIIREKQACFVSRGDHSGTHIAEMNLWKAANTDIEKDSGPWYKSIGQGMGAALNFANASNCYVLSDRGTWIYFKNKGHLQILVEGDKRLFNQYGVMLVNPFRFPFVSFISHFATLCGTSPSAASNSASLRMRVFLFSMPLRLRSRLRPSPFLNVCSFDLGFSFSICSI